MQAHAQRIRPAGGQADLAPAEGQAGPVGLTVAKIEGKGAVQGSIEEGRVQAKGSGLLPLLRRQGDLRVDLVSLLPGRLRPWKAGPYSMPISARRS